MGAIKRSRYEYLASHGLKLDGKSLVGFGTSLLLEERCRAVGILCGEECYGTRL